MAAYGVTEATVTSLVYLTAATDDLSGEPLVPSGTPLRGITAQVVDDDGAPAHVGELYLGGVGLARGYQGLPAKTAECFVPDGAGRRYRTGDLVRERADGTLVWLGRRDAQIKINALRIEPAEIEAIVHEVCEVAEAIVVFIPGVGDRGSLVAFAAAAGTGRLDIGAIEAHLRDRLHPLMLPDEIVELDHIPLNPNGKIDRAGLVERARRNTTLAVLGCAQV